MRHGVLGLVLVGCGASPEPVTVDASSRPDSANVVVDSDLAADTAEEDTATIEDTAPADVAPSCMNGTRDGEETDLDCGGTLCPKCVTGRTCATALDCVSGSCGKDGVCGCTTLDHCPDGTSCVARLCVAGLASCAATKAAHPSAPDGEYWIKPAEAGAPYRAYCDMALGREICTEPGGVVSGRTREGSTTSWSANAKLDHKLGLCSLYALKGPTYPYDNLQLLLGQTMSTCAAFGFKADGVLGNCGYGTTTGKGKCGFVVTTLNRYGNSCTSCTTNPGTFRDYTLQGPISSGSVLTNVSGTIKTTCRVR